MIFTYLLSVVITRTTLTYKNGKTKRKVEPKLKWQRKRKCQRKTKTKMALKTKKTLLLSAYHSYRCPEPISMWAVSQRQKRVLHEKCLQEAAESQRSTA